MPPKTITPIPISCILKIACIIFGLTIPISDTIAQETGIRLSFNRQNNFSYSTLFSYRHHLDFQKHHLQLFRAHDNIYNTQRAKNPLVQLNTLTELRYLYDLSAKFSLLSFIESSQFYNSRNNRVSIYQGIEFRPKDFIRIRAMAGYSWDARRNTVDQGFSPAISLQAQHKWEDNLQMQTYLSLRTKYILPRHQRNFSFATYWQKGFNEEATLLFGLRASSNELDDYKANSIEKIKIDTIAPNFNFRYKLWKGLYWESENSFSYARRQFDYVAYKINRPEFNDLAFQHLQVDSRQRIALQTKSLEAAANFNYQYINRRYQLENSMDTSETVFQQLREREQQKDFVQNKTIVDLYLLWRVNKKHELTLTALNHYMMFDTPSETNYDDRDELIHGLSLHWGTRWNNRLYTSYKLIGNRRQYAFLFQQRSIDNYTQRSLRMEFRYTWKIHRKLQLKGEQFLYVTYNVKDFEDLNRTDRSTRNLESRAILSYRPNAKLTSILSLYRKETHLSYLNWEEFSETTLDTTRTFIAELRNQLQLTPKQKKFQLLLNPGYKHFSQSRFLNTAMIDLNNFLQPINLHIQNLQSGPLTSIQILTPAGSNIELSIWWQYQRQRFRYIPIENLTTLAATYREENLLSGTRNFRPFTRLQLNWPL